MAKAHRETDRARKEAAAWFARLSAPSVSTRALREFREWRRSPINRAAYEKVEQVWSSAGALQGDPEIRALGGRSLRKRRGGGLWRGWGWSAPAGAALGALAVALVVLAAFAVLTLRAPVYESGVGELRVVRLEDGSVMRLNTDSRAVVRYGPKARRIRMDRGEALFEVARETDRPFIVAADGAEVRALGTRFDVRRTRDRVQVVLLEGRVEVRSGEEQRIVLRPNQRVAVVGEALQPVAAVDGARLTSWTEGRLVFDATPLGEALGEVNRYATRKVRLAAPGLEGAAVSGVFRTGDAEAFAAAVAAVFELQVVEGRGEALVLRPKAASGA